MPFILNKDTSFKFEYNNSEAAVYAVNFLKRDFEKVFSDTLSESENADISISIDLSIKEPESYHISVSDKKIDVLCSDELGFIYGIFHISRSYLGVDDFWFWAEKEPEKKNEVIIPEEVYTSPVPKVRYRGWFVNDEVCLIGWSDVYPPSRQIWECVFETLLRLGGNMVIPGTDLPRNGQHFEIASQMGLYITHHHAEPLGGEMFLRAYPNKEASYDKHPDLFEKLWAEAIEKNKNKKIIWTLGFRGQGDAPFWQNDPKYKTPESRAGIIQKVIKKQYSMICEKVENPVCAVYLYGEITELYEGGYLSFPNNFIKIWSDNGYGKMVTRRRGNHNPRISSLPESGENHGLYYHITFHDLQASSHLTLLGNPPEFVKNELETAFEKHADKYLLLNCGNIRPHIYMLDLVSRMWNSGDTDINAFKKSFALKYLGNENAINCYNEYFSAVPKYGPNDDDRAGEEFYYHTARRIASEWAKGNTDSVCRQLVWVAGEKPLKKQAVHILEICEKALPKLTFLVKSCENTISIIPDNRKIFFKDNIYFQSRLHLSGVNGLILLLRAFSEYKEGRFAECFVTLTDSMNEYNKGISLLSEGEHGKWKNFYSADWLTNVRITVYAVDSLRRFVRLVNDGPDFFRWYKNNVIPETERQIYLENTQRQTFSDDELADKLRNAFGI